MVKTPLIIIGSGGHAKVVIEIAKTSLIFDLVGLIDDYRQVGEKTLKVPILGGLKDLPQIASNYSSELQFFIAIGDNYQRFLVYQKMLELIPTCRFASLIHPNAEISYSAKLSEGSVIMAGAILNSQAVVGSFCIINTRSSLDHDVEVQDFASIAPGATLGGNVKVGTFSAVGIGATIKHKVKIGSNSIIGAGAVVLKDIKDFVVAYGMPAAVIRTRAADEPYL